MTEETARPATEHEWPSSNEQTVDAVPREARPFQGHRAGIVSRSIANTVDLALVQLSVFGTYLGWAGFRFLLNPTGFSMPPLTFAKWLILSGSLLFAYFFVSWATTGRTYGDHLMGLRVVGFRGTRMRPAGAAVRALFCCLVPIGLFWVVVSRQNRSVQDTVMRTSVIYDWETHRPAKAEGSTSPPA